MGDQSGTQPSFSQGLIHILNFVPGLYTRMLINENKKLIQHFFRFLDLEEPDCFMNKSPRLGAHRPPSPLRHFCLTKCCGPRHTTSSSGWKAHGEPQEVGGLESQVTSEPLLESQVEWAEAQTFAHCSNGSVGESKSQERKYP